MCAVLVGETLRGREFVGVMWKKRDANEAWIYPWRDDGRVLNGAGIKSVVCWTIDLSGRIFKFSKI
jgi:hypothetical protein